MIYLTLFFYFLKFLNLKYFVAGLSSSTVSPSADFVESKRRRNEIFNSELKRQRERIGRIEKISVLFKGVSEDTEMVLNKFISTPYNVAQRKY